MVGEREGVIDPASAQSRVRLHHNACVHVDMGVLCVVPGVWGRGHGSALRKKGRGVVKETLALAVGKEARGVRSHAWVRSV